MSDSAFYSATSDVSFNSLSAAIVASFTNALGSLRRGMIDLC